MISWVSLNFYDLNAIYAFRSIVKNIWSFRGLPKFQGFKGMSIDLNPVLGI